MAVHKSASYNEHIIIILNSPIHSLYGGGQFCNYNLNYNRNDGSNGSIRNGFPRNYHLHSSLESQFSHM